MEHLTPEQQHFLLSAIRDVPDFPKPGIVFKDITTLLNNPAAFRMLIDHLAARYRDRGFDYVAGIESRGFIFGAALADRLGIGFVPVRKKGKLPAKTVSESYALEYGTDEVEIHLDAFEGRPGAKILLIDDLIATGGTARAAVRLIDKTGASCAEACFIISLSFLPGAAELARHVPVYSVLEIA